MYGSMNPTSWMFLILHSLIFILHTQVLKSAWMPRVKPSTRFSVVGCVLDGSISCRVEERRSDRKAPGPDKFPNGLAPLLSPVEAIPHFSTPLGFHLGD
jgi:hypothetical protein